MSSTQSQIETSYDVSNEFFRLWLDESMHYTSATYLKEDDTLEQAQENKAKLLADYAEVGPDSLVLDIGCGWGAMLEYLSRRGCRRADGITLSTAQHGEILRRKIPGINAIICDYAKYEPAEKYDALVSIEMVDHVCSPAQAREGLAIPLYREFFRKTAEWVQPGAYFGFQAILRDRVPRNRADLADLQFTADVIFPGGLNPRMEELVAAARPYWEVMELRTQRSCYGKTTAEWRRRLRLNEQTIRAKWGDQVYSDYDRYLSACVNAFDVFYSSSLQMKLRVCK